MQFLFSIASAALIAGAASQTLKDNAVQQASSKTGQEGGGEENQADSLTSKENFINFCSGKTLTNGLQVQAGSCNGIPMGEIPAKGKMVSTIITFPTADQAVDAQKTFDIKVKTTNLVAGSFTNPDKTYYSAPQQLKNGQIVGHTHVTVQTLGKDMNPSQPPDPTKFVFFKGINDQGDGNGNLAATVTGGLPAGFYRVCTLGSASNHQPLLMPVAQRGAQDDCTKFEVKQGGGGGGQNKAKNAGGQGNNDNQGQDNNKNQGQDKNKNQGQDNKNQGQDNKNQGQDNKNQGQDNKNQGQDNKNQGQDNKNQGQDGKNGKDGKQKRFTRVFIS